MEEQGKNLAQDFHQENDPLVHIFRGTFRVYYVSSEGDIHEIWWNDLAKRWDFYNIMKDLPSTSAIPSAVHPQTLVSNVVNDREHIFYLGADKCVHELSIVGTDLKHYNLTTTTEATPADTSISLACYGNETSQSVFYIDLEGNLHELYWNKRWQHLNHSQRLKETHNAENLVAAIPAQVLFTRKDDDFIHVIYWDFKLNVWRYLNISKECGAPPAAHEKVSLYSTGQVPHIIYRGKDHHLYEMNFTKKWKFYDLTDKAKAPLASGHPSGMSIPQPGAQFEQHIYYRDNVAGRMFELYHPPKVVREWKSYNLSEATKAPALLGIPVVVSNNFHGNGCHFFSRSLDDHLHEFMWNFPTARWLHFDLTDAISLQMQLSQLKAAQKREAITSGASESLNDSGSLTDSSEKPKPAVDCVVCFSNPVNAVVLPCGHATLCLECAQAIVNSTGNCPICRARVQQVIKIYLQ